VVGWTGLATRTLRHRTLHLAVVPWATPGRTLRFAIAASARWTVLWPASLIVHTPFLLPPWAATASRAAAAPRSAALGSRGRRARRRIIRPGRRSSAALGLALARVVQQP